MKFLFTVITLFSTCYFSFAQSNYKAGYFVNNQNDTVRGFIDQRERFNNPKEFDFKKDLSQKAMQVSVTQAVAVGINGYDYYDRFTVKISSGYIDVNRLGDAVDSTYTTDIVFLRSIRKGKNISLYAYTDNIKTRYYILNNADKKINELNYFLYLSSATRSVVTYDRYKGQLIAFANQYQSLSPDLNKRIKTSLYNEGPLLKIVQLINGDNSTTGSNSKSLSGNRFFIGVGAKSSTLTFNGIAIAFPDGTNKSSISPTINGGIDFLLNRETQKIIFRIEASFANDQYNFDNILVAEQADKTYGNLDLKIFTTTIHPQIIYNFLSTNTLKIFIDAGFVFNKMFYNNYTYTTSQVISPTLSIPTTKNKFPVFQGSAAAVPVKLGLVINKNIEIYAQYEASPSLIQYAGSSASINSYMGGVNYLFPIK